MAVKAGFASISRRIMFLIVLTVIIPPLGIDEYTPSLPHMIFPLHATVALMQLTVTIYMFAFALGQGTCGYLADSFGRRPIVVWTFPLFLVGSIICIFSHSISVLYSGRILQGLGVGGMALSGPAMIADCFTGKDINRASGYYSTVYSFIPISAPIFGGYIQEYLGWRANFVFMLILGLIIYAYFLWRMPETHKPTDADKINFSNIIRNYSAVLGNKQYMLAVTCMTLTWAMFIVFSIMGPFIIQGRLGYSPSAYGLMALLIGLGFFVGNLLNNLIFKKTSALHIIQLGLIIMILMAILLLLFPLLGYVNVWVIMSPLFVIMIGAGLCFPHFNADAVSAVPQYAGVAGALIGTLILIGTVIITAIITRFHAHSPKIMASVFLILSVLCLLTHYFSKKSGRLHA